MGPVHQLISSSFTFPPVFAAVSEVVAAVSTFVPRFKLQVGVPMICAGWIDAVFIRNDL